MFERVNWDALERRDYQVRTAEEILRSGENTLVVMPTGLGKTVVGALVLSEAEKGLMLAPTVPLVHQHAVFLSKVLRDVRVEALSGRVSPDERGSLWRKADVVVATPHALRNDILEGRVDPSEVDVAVFDEAHRAVGNYPYVFVSEQLENVLKVGLTASPGSNEERLREVIRNLDVSKIVLKTEDDPDVKRYIGRVKVEWVEVSLPEEFAEAVRRLSEAYRDRLEDLRDMGLLDRVDGVWIGRLLALKEELSSGDKDEETMRALGRIAEAIKLAKAREALETQGASAFLSFVERLRGSKRFTDRRLRADPRLHEAVLGVKEYLKASGVDHPKMEELVDLIEDAERALVFTQFKETAEAVVRHLEDEDVKAGLLLGKAWMSDREQVEALEAFRRGDFDVLVATSVGEEGLDVPSCDVVVSYEPVPSEIRTVQRFGRTARDGRSGTAYVLVSKASGVKTLDEINYWVARSKERKMIETVRRLVGELEGRRRTRHGRERAFGTVSRRGVVRLDEFIREGGGSGGGSGDDVNVDVGGVPTVIVDSREMNSKVVEELRRRRVRMVRETLDVGDYIVGDGVGVERKSGRDLAESIKDGRLLSQLKDLARAFERPVLIVEGDPYRYLDPEAVRGALASAVADFGVSVVTVGGPEETASFLHRLALRMVKEGRRPRVPRGSRDRGDPRVEMLCAIPGVGPELAVRLLEAFGSIGEVVNASVRDLKKVPGIGEKKARMIRRFLWGRG